MNWLKNNLLSALGFVVIGSLATNFYFIRKTNEIPLTIKMEVDSAVQKIYLAIKEAEKPPIIKTPNLAHKGGNFYYFEGSVQKQSFRIIDEYEYDPDYPNEIWSGYLTYVKAKNGGQYYIWTDKKMTNIGQQVNGWFLTDGLSKFELEKRRTDTVYLQVIYPIVERKLYIK